MQWLRLYHDTPNDPKWRLVAVRSGQPVGNVLAVWVQMLVCASEAENRGTLESWDDEIVAAMLGYAPAIVTAIRASMQGLVLDGFALTGWDKRQRQSDDAGGRQRKTRERRTPNPPGDSGGSGHGGNGHDCDNAATVAGQNGNVARQTEDVAGLSLRAQTPELEKKEDSEAVASVAGATSGSANVVRIPLTAQGQLFGPVLEDFVVAVTDVCLSEIRSQFGKACSHLGPDAALALARQALLRAEPWRWLCKSINERITAAGGRPGKPLEKGLADFLDLYEQRKAEMA